MFFLRYTLRDYLRLAEIGNRLRGGVFDLWNYREIVFPAVEEYSESIRKGTKFAHNNEFYVICPDATSRIIRDFNNGEARIYYISEVLDGEIHGVWEAGVELIGGREPDMYVEVPSVLITALESLGIEDFYIDVGSVKVWEEATRGIELQGRSQEGPFNQKLRDHRIPADIRGQEKGFVETLQLQGEEVGRRKARRDSGAPRR
ncbi:ATP phosphoribosyltransferase regulatory subunit [Thermococcus sp. JCM 11816]|uniref:ATP phosphoribosyltransferase regulatory subunit n=1 Tax=Thermococcus sp. (strain JCM 11816 / KS-1) TaxID=1295125 RepID=UPI003465CF0E